MREKQRRMSNSFDSEISETSLEGTNTSSGNSNEVSGMSENDDKSDDDVGSFMNAKDLKNASNKSESDDLSEASHENVNESDQNDDGEIIAKASDNSSDESGSNDSIETSHANVSRDESDQLDDGEIIVKSSYNSSKRIEMNDPIETSHANASATFIAKNDKHGDDSIVVEQSSNISDRFEASYASSVGSHEHNDKQIVASTPKISIIISNSDDSSGASTIGKIEETNQSSRVYPGQSQTCKFWNLFYCYILL